MATCNKEKQRELFAKSQYKKKLQKKSRNTKSLENKRKQKYKEYRIQYIKDPEFRKQEIIKKRKKYFDNKYHEAERSRRKYAKKKIAKQREYFKVLNQEDPDKSYTQTLIKILTLDVLSSQERIQIKQSFYYEIKRMQKQDEKAKEEAQRIKEEALSFGMSIQEYKDKLAKDKKEKEKKERTKKIIQEFFSDEQLEINLKLEKLKKKIPTYSPTAPKDYEIIEKEIKQQMSKISFDHGKTFLDPNDSTDFNIILGKVSRIKTWNAIVEKFDPDTMMAVLESMPANERKQVSLNNNATNRALYLCKYLLKAENNLVL